LIKLAETQLWHRQIVPDLDNHSREIDGFLRCDFLLGREELIREEVW